MIKGVNKTVIEVKCTDNGYFEKAILFVNPEQSHVSEKKLKSEAEKYVDMIRIGIKTETIPSPSARARKKRKRSLAVISVVSIFLIAAAGILFFVF